VLWRNLAGQRLQLRRNLTVRFLQCIDSGGFGCGCYRNGGLCGRCRRLLDFFACTLGSCFFLVTGLATGFALCGFVFADFFDATDLCSALAGVRFFAFALRAALAGFADFFAVFATGLVS